VKDQALEARRQAYADYFDVEGTIADDGDLSPTAFFAKREFVTMVDFFGFVERNLSRPFLQRVPDLDQRHWVRLLNPAPSSWSSFARVAVQLVELAILQAHRDTCQEDDQIESFSAEASPEKLSSKNAKRKARKKRANEVLKISAESAMPAESLLPLVESVQSEAALASSQDVTSSFVENASADLPGPVSEPQCSDAMQAAVGHRPQLALVEDQVAEDSADEDSADEDSVLSVSQALRQSAREACINAQIFSPLSYSQVLEPNGNVFEQSLQQDDACCPDFNVNANVDDSLMSVSQSLRHTAREARIHATTTPAIIASQALRASAREARIYAEIQYDQSRQERGRPRPPSLVFADGSSGENWVEGFRMIVKNTFIDAEVEGPGNPLESCAKRAFSSP
jgi:hypothetical protein